MDFGGYEVLYLLGSLALLLPLQPIVWVGGNLRPHRRFFEQGDTFLPQVGVPGLDCQVPQVRVLVDWEFWVEVLRV